MITIIIVFFVTKVRTLNYFLDQAKEIDEAKIARISGLEKQLQEEKMLNHSLEKELEAFSKSKEKIQELNNHIDHLKNDLALQVQEHMESFHHQQSAYEQLKIHHDLLNEKYEKLEEEYQFLKKRNETLVEENNSFHTRLRETEVQLNEQQKQNTEKMALMKEHRSELKQEFEQLASRVFEGNSKEFSRLSQENIHSLIKPLESQIGEFKKQVQTLYSDESKDRAMLKQ